MFKKSNDYITVSLSEDCLKVAQIKGSGTSLKLVKVTVQDVSGIPEADLPKVLQSALSGFKSKSAHYIGIVPARMTTTKNIEIPSINNDEIKSIVSLQAGRHTPYSRDEIQIGYINIGVYKSNYTKVLLVIANKNILKKQLAVLEKVGIKVEKVFFAPEGIASFYAKRLGFEQNVSPVGIIDIGESATDFIIALQGKAIMTRNIPIGRQHLRNEGDSAKDRLIEELSSTVESYQSEDIEQVPSEYIVTSDDDLTQQLLPVVEQKLNWTIKSVSYLDHVKVAEKTLRKVATEHGDVSLLDLVASVSIFDEGQVDLLPEEVQLIKSIEVQSREIFKTAALSFVVLILIACLFGLKIYFRNAYLDKIKEQYKVQHQEVLDLEKRSIRSRILQNYLSSRMTSLETVNELYRNIPKEIYLTSIIMDQEGNVSIQGISEIASIVFNLGTTLKESTLFKSVDITSTTARKDRGKDVSAFEITLKIKSDMDADDVQEPLEGEP